MQDLEDTWVTIDDLPKYEINVLGQVRNRRSRHVMKQKKPGFVQVINTNGSNTERKVGTIMARTFLGQDVRTHQVGFRDGNEANVRLDNILIVDIKCKRGHPIEGANRNKSGQCRACQMANNRLREHPDWDCDEVAARYYERYSTVGVNEPGVRHNLGKRNSKGQFV